VGVITGIMLPLRLLLLQRHRKQISFEFLKDGKSFFAIPFSEFRADLLAWAFNGLAVAGFMVARYGIPLETAFKLVIGFVVPGLFTGMLNFLEMESAVMRFLGKEQGTVKVRPDLRLSVARKVTFLLGSVMTVSAVVIGFMLLDDVRYLVKNRATLGAEHFHSIFYEVGFVIVVMLVFSITIIGRFSRNLRELFHLQIQTLEEVGNGSYDKRVPIVSSDEFGIIASQTNDMISGLRERDFIRETFGRYVPREISELILSGKIPLDGELRNVTVLFCDIRKFTSFVESRRPQQVVKRINQYFTEMTKAIQNHGGFVLQFIGDEIEAVFGAPVASENHPEMAVRAAMEMRERLAQLNAGWESEGDEPFRHGIGITTGEVLAGNIGSPDRHSYLMVGDAVNLAARIQEMTKEFRCDILVSGYTCDALTNGFNMEHAGKVRVRGMELETDLYEVV